MSWLGRIGSALFVACALASCGADDDPTPKPACAACAAKSYTCSIVGEQVHFDVSFDSGDCVLKTDNVTVGSKTIYCEPLRVCGGSGCEGATVEGSKLTFGGVTCWAG